tara:strand:- start:1211 stop:2083 length:873 start_codon:yes stop_codon:yes gene_type:complete
VIKLIGIFKKINLSLQKKKEIFLIESNNDVEFILDSLLPESIIGIDTEFDWRNTYYPKLCLLQIASKNKIFLIDCLKIDDFHFLKELLEDPQKTIVMHSARSDSTVLKTNLDIRLKKVFDIQLAETFLSTQEIKNYGFLVEKYTGVRLKKSETNSNWLKRPFSSDQLQYAADDVNFLIEIFKKQIKKLKKNDLINMIFKISKKESYLGNQKLYLSRLKKLKKATESEKKIFMWRENYSSKLNIPPSYIFDQKKIKFVAKNIEDFPSDQNNLKNIFKKEIYAIDFLKEFKK